MLTQEQIDAFERDGFTVCPGFLKNRVNRISRIMKVAKIQRMATISGFKMSLPRA